METINGHPMMNTETERSHRLFNYLKQSEKGFKRRQHNHDTSTYRQDNHASKCSSRHIQVVEATSDHHYNNNVSHASRRQDSCYCCRRRHKPSPLEQLNYHHHLTTRKIKRSSLSLVTSIIVNIFISISFRPQTVLSYTMMSAGGFQPNHMNSGQFTIAQLCAGKSQFPVTKRIEGAVLSSNADADVNCTITFRTKSTQQHFVIRFEELKLGCDDHLKMFDSDLDYGQPSIKDFSCRDSLASVPTMKTTGTFLTMRFSSDSKTKPGDGFRLVATAVFDVPMWDCPPEYSLCRNQLCISKSLFCDDINHCIDNSDESSCSSRIGIGGPGSNGGGSIFSGDLTLTNALGLLVVLVFIIFTCVIIFIVTIYCRQENQYAQYQHQNHLQLQLQQQQQQQQGVIGVPLQTYPNRQIVMLLANGP